MLKEIECKLDKSKKHGNENNSLSIKLRLCSLLNFIYLYK